MKRRVLIGMSVLVLCAVIAIPLLVRGSPDGNRLQALLWCRANSSENRASVVARVDGYDITRADYESSLALINGPVRPLTDNAPEIFRALDAVHEDYTPELRALARCVRLAAQHLEAGRLGVDVGLEEAEAYIEEMRRTATDAESQQLFTLMEEHFGAQEYWTEIAPAVYSRSLSIMALKRHVKAESPDLKGLGAWLAYEYGLALAAADSLVIVDARMAADVTEHRVRSYLREMGAVARARRR